MKRRLTLEVMDQQSHQKDINSNENSSSSENHQMRVKKRNGSFVPVDVNKIVNVVIACSNGLKEVDPLRVATKAISGLYDGATTKELDELAISTSSMLISEDPSIQNSLQDS